MKESTKKAICAKKLKELNIFFNTLQLSTLHKNINKKILERLLFFDSVCFSQHILKLGLYPGGVKSGMNFTLEPEWAFIRDFTVPQKRQSNSLYEENMFDFSQITTLSKKGYYQRTFKRGVYHAFQVKGMLRPIFSIDINTVIGTENLCKNYFKKLYFQNI